MCWCQWRLLSWVQGLPAFLCCYIVSSEKENNHDLAAERNNEEDDELWRLVDEAEEAESWGAEEEDEVAVAVTEVIAFVEDCGGEVDFEKFRWDVDRG